MTGPLIVSFPGNGGLAEIVAGRTGGEFIALSLHRFPDEETLVRYDVPVAGRSVVLVCTLDRPDGKFLPLIFAAATARELGAVQIGLVAPYLAYMRQDTRFHPGEAVTSGIFAQALSQRFDWLLTVDPHLHRVHALNDVYAIPARALHAGPAIAHWIKTQVRSPLLVGPDSESAQWVSEIAKAAGAPFIVLEKTRHGDREVRISLPEDMTRWRDHAPVLVDDIISTGQSMVQTLGGLRAAQLQPAICVGIHAVFAADAYDALRAAGATQIVTTDTIPHPTNAIIMNCRLADGVARFLACA